MDEQARSSTFKLKALPEGTTAGARAQQIG
jgi:hypothetical protein